METGGSGGVGRPQVSFCAPAGRVGPRAQSAAVAQSAVGTPVPGAWGREAAGSAPGPGVAPAPPVASRWGRASEPGAAKPASSEALLRGCTWALASGLSHDPSPRAHRDHPGESTRTWQSSRLESRATEPQMRWKVARRGGRRVIDTCPYPRGRNLHRPELPSAVAFVYLLLVTRRSLLRVGLLAQAPWLALGDGDVLALSGVRVSQRRPPGAVHRIAE